MLSRSRSRCPLLWPQQNTSAQAEGALNDKLDLILSIDVYVEVQRILAGSLALDALECQRGRAIGRVQVDVLFAPATPHGGVEHRRPELGQSFWVGAIDRYRAPARARGRHAANVSGRRRRHARISRMAELAAALVVIRHSTVSKRQE
ncbi:MAG: hypothetical protein QOE58_1328 [Actinomycetota bacterium]|nr:hypothetical protein [Actinomycetota bacterium]